VEDPPWSMPGDTDRGPFCPEPLPDTSLRGRSDVEAGADLAGRAAGAGFSAGRAAGAVRSAGRAAGAGGAEAGAAATGGAEIAPAIAGAGEVGLGGGA
jgi:hypothetical protein